METCNWYDVPCHYSWLQQEIKQLFLSFYETIVFAFADLLESIDAPEWLLVDTVTVPESALYFYDLLRIPLLINIVISALVLRYAIKKIPFIGG